MSLGIDDLILCLFCSLVFGANAGLVIGCLMSDRTWRKLATEHNAGHYDAKTGAFKWNDAAPQAQGDRER